MKIPTKFREYIWLVNTIRKAGRITFAQIQEKWLETDMSEGVELVHSTFYRHKDAIEDIFGIFIECDRKDGYKFYIGNEEVLSEDSVQNWMLSMRNLSRSVTEAGWQYTKTKRKTVCVLCLPCRLKWRNGYTNGSFSRTVMWYSGRITTPSRISTCQNTWISVPHRPLCRYTWEIHGSLPIPVFRRI